MSNLKMALLAIAAPVGACATRTHDAPPIIPAGYNFAYIAPQGADIGLVQAFDDGARTYLQFDDAPRDLKVSAGSAESLKYRVSTPYITLEGVYPNLLISRDEHSTTIVNESADPTPLPTPYPTAPEAPAAADRVAEPALERIAAIGVPESIQTMHAHLRVTELNREISELETRIQRLQEELNNARLAGRETSAYFLAVGAAPRLILQFGDNSAQIQVDEAVLEPLGAAARAANRIYLHGHTDAFVASDAGTDLAIRRAVAVRQLLLSQEVSPSRIRLFYRGAGNFIANNATPEGKALNRRVEIEFRKW
jgi:outer membrane protein OmpA-like peptidoglycan-associated protein